MPIKWNSIESHKEQMTYTCHNMNGCQEHYTKKPHVKITYSVIFVLIVQKRHIFKTESRSVVYLGLETGVSIRYKIFLDDKSALKLYCDVGLKV